MSARERSLMMARHRKEPRTVFTLLHVLNGISGSFLSSSETLLETLADSDKIYRSFAREKGKACEGIAENKLFYRKNSSKSSKGEERKIASRSL